MDQYLPLVVMVVLAVAFGVISELVSNLVSPKRSTPAKTAPYECGIVPRREPPERFPVRFYLVAMIFIIFDIEIIFLYPYAVIYRGLGAFGLGELVVFSIPVFIAFVYLIANGALDWGPIKKARTPRDDAMVSPERTVATTIRRVGLDGRPSGTEAA